MIRAAELALFLAPLVLYALWLRVGRSGGMAPSRLALAILSIAVVVLGVALAWASLHERSAGDTRYVPAELRDGRIVPGHGV